MSRLGVFWATHACTIPILGVGGEWVWCQNLPGLVPRNPGSPLNRKVVPLVTVWQVRGKVDGRAPHHWVGGGWSGASSGCPPSDTLNDPPLSPVPQDWNENKNIENLSSPYLPELNHCGSAMLCGVITNRLTVQICLLCFLVTPVPARKASTPPVWWCEVWRLESP